MRPCSSIRRPTSGSRLTRADERVRARAQVWPGGECVPPGCRVVVAPTRLRWRRRRLRRRLARRLPRRGRDAVGARSPSARGGGRELARPDRRRCGPPRELPGDAATRRTSPCRACGSARPASISLPRRSARTLPAWTLSSRCIARGRGEPCAQFWSSPGRRCSTAIEVGIPPQERRRSAEARGHAERCRSSARSVTESARASTGPARSGRRRPSAAIAVALGKSRRGCRPAIRSETRDSRRGVRGRSATRRRRRASRRPTAAAGSAPARTLRRGMSCTPRRVIGDVNAMNRPAPDGLEPAALTGRKQRPSATARVLRRQVLAWVVGAEAEEVGDLLPFDVR